MMDFMEQKALCQIVKEEILAKYTFTPTDIRILKISENITLLLQTIEAEKYILRINRPDYHSFEELLGEIIWMDSIQQETDIQIPSIIHNRYGEEISKFDYINPYGVYYTVFSFVPGELLHSVELEALIPHMKDVGILAAKLHLQVQQNPNLAQLRRFTWNYEDLIGPKARWGNWREHDLVTPPQIAILSNALDLIEARLHTYGKTPHNYGLIHSDLHLSNVIYHDSKIQLIDFDDCGYGWFLYECGCSVLQYNEGIEELVNSWLSGYQTIRPLPKKDLNEVWTFVILRRISRIAWIHTHMNSDTAASIDDFQKYITITVDYCEQYIKNH